MKQTCIGKSRGEETGTHGPEVWRWPHHLGLNKIESTRFPLVYHEREKAAKKKPVKKRKCVRTDSKNHGVNEINKSVRPWGGPEKKWGRKENCRQGAACGLGKGRRGPIRFHGSSYYPRPHYRWQNLKNRSSNRSDVEALGIRKALNGVPFHLRK